MIKEIDIEIFRHISNQMEATEIYLGHIAFSFHYTQAQYKATCTEAFPFTPFDKVICELLKVEEHLSFENIGDILGMNVYESENPKRYLDLAEKEILMEALQSLSSPDYRMIEGGDIQYSRCRLTPIGREYAEKKSKFRITANKPFTVYYDQTTGKHEQAKQNFEYVDGKPSSKEFEVELVDDSTLKAIAAVQIPEIYNPSKQYSFTDAVLVKKRNLSIDYPVALTFSLTDKTYHLYCYDIGNKKLHPYFNSWLNDSPEVKRQVIDGFTLRASGITVESDSVHEQITQQFSEYTKGIKLHTVKSDLLNNEYIDEQLFYSSFSELINATEEVELFLCLPFVSDSVFKSVKEVVQKFGNDRSRLFMVFPNLLSTKHQQDFDQLKSLTTGTANLFVMQQPVKTLVLCCQKEENSYEIGLLNTTIGGVVKKFAKRKLWDERTTKVKNYLLEKFSDGYALSVCEKVNEVVNNDIQKTVSKAQLDELAFYEFKLQPFTGMGKYAETIKLALEFIKSFRTERISLLEEKLEAQFKELESKLTTVSDEKEFVEIQKQFASIKAEILFDNSELFKRSEELLKLIIIKKNEFEEAKRTHSFIIDTNVFIKDPLIISKIEAKNKIVIAAKVIDELDSFKANAQLKEVATKSISEIFKDKNKNIHRVKANLKLLPPDFSKRDPDNLILAVALMYKHKHGILISDDKGLHEKAKTVEMDAMTYDNFIATFVNPKKQ